MGRLASASGVWEHRGRRDRDVRRFAFLSVRIRPRSHSFPALRQARQDTTRHDTRRRPWAGRPWHPSTHHWVPSAALQELAGAAGMASWRDQAETEPAFHISRFQAHPTRHAARPKPSSFAADRLCAACAFSCPSHGTLARLNVSNLARCYQPVCVCRPPLTADSGPYS